MQNGAELLGVDGMRYFVRPADAVEPLPLRTPKVKVTEVGLGPVNVAQQELRRALAAVDGLPRVAGEPSIEALLAAAIDRFGWAS